VTAIAAKTLKEHIHFLHPAKPAILKKCCRQILEALAYLHTGFPSPIIHRDLKCDNIFIDGPTGDIKIGDFGLAKNNPMNGEACTKTMIGTPGFMAPELFEEEYNELVDIYAFGMVVLEMATDEYPYVECNNILLSLLKKGAENVMPAALQMVTDPKLKEFITLLLKKASERPSAVELLANTVWPLDEESTDAGAAFDDKKSDADSVAPAVRTDDETEEKYEETDPKVLRVIVQRTENLSVISVQLHIKEPFEEDITKIELGTFDFHTCTPTQFTETAMHSTLTDLGITDKEFFKSALASMIKTETNPLITAWNRPKQQKKKAEIVKLLTELGIPVEMATPFVDEDIKVEDLLNGVFSKTDIEELLPKIGPRRRLLTYLAKHGTGSTGASPPAMLAVVDAAVSATTSITRSLSDSPDPALPATPNAGVPTAASKQTTPVANRGETPKNSPRNADTTTTTTTTTSNGSNIPSSVNSGGDIEPARRLNLSAQEQDQIAINANLVSPTHRSVERSRESLLSPSPGVVPPGMSPVGAAQVAKGAMSPIGTVPRTNLQTISPLTAGNVPRPGPREVPIPVAVAAGQAMHAESRAEETLESVVLDSRESLDSVVPPGVSSPTPVGTRAKSSMNALELTMPTEDSSPTIATVQDDEDSERGSSELPPSTPPRAVLVKSASAASLPLSASTATNRPLSRASSPRMQSPSSSSSSSLFPPSSSSSSASVAAVVAASSSFTSSSLPTTPTLHASSVSISAPLMPVSTVGGSGDEDQSVAMLVPVRSSSTPQTSPPLAVARGQSTGRPAEVNKAMTMKPAVGRMAPRNGPLLQPAQSSSSQSSLNSTPLGSPTGWSRTVQSQQHPQQQYQHVPQPVFARVVSAPTFSDHHNHMHRPRGSFDMTVPSHPSLSMRPATAPSSSPAAFDVMDDPLSAASLSLEPSEADLFSFSASPPSSVSEVPSSMSGMRDGMEVPRLAIGTGTTSNPAWLKVKLKVVGGQQTGNVTPPVVTTPSGRQSPSVLTPSGSESRSRRNSPTRRNSGHSLMGQKSLQEMKQEGSRPKKAVKADGVLLPKKAMHDSEAKALIDRLTNLSSLNKQQQQQQQQNNNSTNNNSTNNNTTNSSNNNNGNNSNNNGNNSGNNSNNNSARGSLC
jgi:serine/threonine protein kinase